jgi:hypothetical protein
MKRILAILAIAISVVTAQFASAQSVQHPHMVQVAYGGAFNMNCNVNGVTYPVDGAFNVWALNVYGRWFIIGQLTNNGNGFFVITPNGTYPASCY